MPVFSDGQVIEPDEVLLDGAFYNGSVVSPQATRDFRPRITGGKTVDLMALPEAQRGLPAGRGDIVMGMDSTGRDPVAPQTDFSEPMATPYTERPALPVQPLAGVNLGLWSGGKSQLAYKAPPFELPGETVGLGLSLQAPQTAPVIDMPMPQSQGVVGGTPAPSAQPFGGVVQQQAPRADTTTHATQLGMPAPDALPVPNAATAPVMGQAMPAQAMPAQAMPTPAMPVMPQRSMPTVQQTPVQDEMMVVPPAQPEQAVTPIPNTRNA
ncbi:MAG: hypothetical protein RR014_06630, partial [Bilophila sp.]